MTTTNHDAALTVMWATRIDDDTPAKDASDLLDELGLKVDHKVPPDPDPKHLMLVYPNKLALSKPKRRVEEEDDDELEDMPKPTRRRKERPEPQHGSHAARRWHANRHEKLSTCAVCGPWWSDYQRAYRERRTANGRSVK